MELQEPFVFSRQSSLFSQIMAELRDEQIQQDRLRFRVNMERAGELMAYEISKRMPYAEHEITTPLGATMMSIPAEQPVLVAILRAALPFHQGFLRMFDAADNAFISAYRKHTSDIKFIVKVEYISSPDISDRIIVLLDPMLATGQSMVLCYEQLLRYGTPRQVFIACVIASEEGLEYLQRHIPEAQIFVGDIDSELTAKGYIVPGLGDAGDLSYGAKN